MVRMISLSSLSVQHTPDRSCDGWPPAEEATYEERLAVAVEAQQRRRAKVKRHAKAQAAKAQAAAVPKAVDLGYSSSEGLGGTP